MGLCKYFLPFCVLVIQFTEPVKANVLKDTLIAKITKVISRCQLELPPEERNITVQITCIGVETEDGNIEKLNKKQMGERFGWTNTAICGSMESIECEEVLPSTTTTTTVATTTPQITPPPSPVTEDTSICVDIIFVIDASCSVVKYYQREAIKIIERFTRDLRFKDDEKKKQSNDNLAKLSVFRVPFVKKSSDAEKTVDSILDFVSTISLDQRKLSNVAVIPFHATALNTTIPFQNNRKQLQRGFRQLMKYERICKTFGDQAYKKAAEFFSAIPKRDRNVVVIFGDGRNTGIKHQRLSEQAMERLKSQHNVDIIWVKTPTRILNQSKTPFQQASEITQGHLHIERHVMASHIFDITEGNINTKIMDHFFQFYPCEN